MQGRPSQRAIGLPGPPRESRVPPLVRLGADGQLRIRRPPRVAYAGGVYAMQVLLRIRRPPRVAYCLWRDFAWLFVGTSQCLVDST